jgi:sugar phosphate isomerase/epimerase
MSCTRREFGTRALSAVPALAMLPSYDWLAASPQSSKPNSKFAGVQVGMNVPYNFHAPAPVGNNMPGDEVLRRCVRLGISAVELRTQPVEMFLGSPAFSGGRADDVHRWRRLVSMEKVQAFRRMYDNAGVSIEIMKVDNLFNLADDELDYVFTLARNLGARAISTEISNPVSNTKRVGQFANKHRLWVGYHGHTETGPPQWEEAFGYSPRNGANLDIGHFVAGFSQSPVPFLKQHHDRITHVHVKDRRLGTKGGVNVPFGQGDTPIIEVLHLIRDNKWRIQATIEFEYNPPPGPDGRSRQWTDEEGMAEMAKCVQYCKDALTA